MLARPEAVDTTELTETEQRNLRAVTDVLHFWNTHDIDGVLTFYNDGITWRNIALEETYHGKAEVRAFLQRLFGAFPDMNFQVTHKIARGNNVAEKWLIRATHLGAFLGVPPTGRSVEIPGMSMIEMRDGKFLRDEFYFDSGIVLRQFRLLPPLSMAETPIGRGALWLAVNGRRAAPAAAGLAAAGLAVLALRRRRARKA
jgi:steroid delta-isomerase-like uncharacterized protein